MAQIVNGFFPGKLEPTTTVGGCIDIFEDAWPSPKDTISLIEKEVLDPTSGIHWERAGTIGQGINQNKRTNYLMSITGNAEKDNTVCQNIHNQMNMLLLATTIPYAIKHDIEQLHHESYQLLKYSTGQEYKAHADGSTGTGRAVSAIVYLNEDFGGGEVEFVNFGLKIKPKPGLLLLFPSTYPYSHIAHPVTSGTKYALVTWIHDRPLSK
jgi:predicted 2-oxoglutarate/Fe(II)-dependent dioxygenase YbiX